MNAVEIEEAVSELAAAPFDADAFPYDFLEAFMQGNVYIERYRHAWTVQSIMESIPKDGPKFRPFLDRGPER